MNSRSKVIWAIVIAIVLIGGGIFTYAYYAGWLSPKADVVDVSKTELKKQLENSGFILIKQSELTQNDSTTKSLNGLTYNQIMADKIKNITNQTKIDPTSDTDLDAVIILTDNDGNPILPDAKKAQSTKTTKALTENELTFTYDDTWSDDQKNQLSTIMAEVYPQIKALIGPPAFNNEVIITRLDECPIGLSGFYTASTNTITLCKNASVNLLEGSDHKRTLIHETAHTFHDDYAIIANNASWEEGMARAVERIILNVWNSPDAFLYYENWSVFDNSDLCAGSVYEYGKNAFLKIYMQDNDFFKNFNKKYYLARTNDNIGYPGVYAVPALFETISEVEGQPIRDWYANQHIFHSYRYSKIEAEIYSDSISLITCSNSPLDLKISLYDHKNNLLGELNPSVEMYKQIYLSDFSGYNANIQQRLKLVLDYGDQRMEVFGSNLSSDITKGIFGIITQANTGTIALSKIGDSNFIPLSAEIVNGNFYFPDQSQESGSYKLTYTIDGKGFSKIINKVPGKYYTVINTHSGDDQEVKDINSALSNLQIINNNSSIEDNFSLHKKYISFANIITNPENYYFESIKQYSDASVNIPLLNSTSSLNNFYNNVFVFLSDGYMIKVEKNYPTSTPTSTATSSSTPTPTITPTSSPSSTYQPISAQDIILKKGNNSITFPYKNGSVSIKGAEKGDFIAYYDGAKHRYIYYDALKDISKLEAGKGYIYRSRKDKTITISGYEITNPVAISLPTIGYYFIGNPFTHDLDAKKIMLTYTDNRGNKKTTDIIGAVKAGYIDKNIYTELGSKPVVIQTGYILPTFKGYWFKTRKTNINIIFNP